MIRFADSGMIAALKEIWIEAFGDSRAYTDFVYNNLFTPDNTLVWVDNKHPVAMMTLLPCSIHTAAGLWATRYVYGVATSRSHRGQGLSSALIRHANDLADQRDEAMVLVPSSAGLFDFYQRNGYHTAFYYKHLVIEQPQILPPLRRYSFTEPDAQQYLALRNEYFAQHGTLCWDEQAIAYRLRENAFSGGRCVVTTHNGIRSLVLYYTAGGTLFVKETTLTEQNLLPVLSGLAADLGCNRVEARLPEWFPMPLERKPFGMLHAKKPLDAQHPYLNLVLD